MEAIINTLRALDIGPSQQFRNLTAFPLLQRSAGEADYITLSQAIRNQTATITEISEGGSVPELLLDNQGDAKVLILDGEELVGAKQNRIANLTILAAAHAKTVLPVSCVEAGRWAYRSRDFKTSERTHFSRGRAAKAAALTENLQSTGTYGADQSMVWDDIQAKHMRMRVSSPTSAMADMFEQNQRATEDYVEQFRAIDNQVGVLFAIDGEVEGMDLFDAPSTLANALPKLVRSFAIDALETASKEERPAKVQNAVRFLDRVAAAHADTYPGIGLGTDIRLSAPLVAGGGLVHEDKLIHLAAFSRPASGGPGARESRFESRLRAQRYERMRRRNGNRDH